MIRRASTFNTSRIDHIYQDRHETGTRLFLHYGDMGDGSQVARVIRGMEPDEVYNLAAQSHVAVSVSATRIHRRCGRIGRHPTPRSHSGLARRH